MYVIMDMEWVVNRAGMPCPTQLAALRVDGHWRRMGSFQSLIRPRDESCHRWTHVAYTGAEREQFLRAPSGIKTFNALFRWLRDDDVLLWWEERAADVFRKGVLRMLTRGVSQQTLLLNGAVSEACHRSGDPYQLAAARQIRVQGPQHASAKDVEAIRALLAGIRLRPEAIRAAQEAQSEDQSAPAKYLYDPATNLLHTAGGGCHVENPQEIANFKNCLRRGYRPCPTCCAAEYRREFMKQSAMVISNTGYNFVYRERSEVFHKAECVHARRIPYWEIKGSADYSTCAELGKRPCRLCRPTSDYRRPRAVSAQAVEAPMAPKKAERVLLPGLTRVLDADEARAYNLYLEAQQKRDATQLSDAGAQDDGCRLPCAGSAFWAARGYRTFHLANCPKLNGLANLEGFARYTQATARGFEPCKCCKPSPKHDLPMPVPKGSRVRPQETAELLNRRCRECGYRGRQEGGFYYIETPVGKWKLDISARPVDLWHINLVMNPGGGFHKQPCLILSLTDAFRYIHHHDRALMERCHNPRRAVDKSE